MGNVETLALGPGKLLVAPVGSAEPADLTTAWNAAWKEIGYTDEGSELAFDLTWDDVTVAEEVDPVGQVLKERVTSVSFAMAEVTVRNLRIALNGGTITSGTGIQTYVPPAASAEGFLAIGFESDDAQERWVFRKTKQSGKVALKRRKGADKTVIPVTMKVFKPTGLDPWKWIAANSRSGGTI